MNRTRRTNGSRIPMAHHGGSRSVGPAIMVALMFWSSMILTAIGTSASEKHAESEPEFVLSVPLRGEWQEIEGGGQFPSNSLPQGMLEPRTSRTHVVHSGQLPPQASNTGAGGSLDFKYFSGLLYSYLQQELPGKTLAVDVHVRESMVSPNSNRPVGIRAALKSAKDDAWVTYLGDTGGWINVTTAGIYHVEIDIPENPVPGDWGGTFYPAWTRLFSVQMICPEGTTHHSAIAFSFSDFTVGEIDFDADRMAWQCVTNGHVLAGTFVPEFAEHSTFIEAMGEGVDLEFEPRSATNSSGHAFSGELSGWFLDFSAFIPNELRTGTGEGAVTISSTNGPASATQSQCLDAADAAGFLHWSLPLAGFQVDETIEELAAENRIRLLLQSPVPHENDSMPVVLGPMRVRRGCLIAFDENWALRDVQGLGGYSTIDIRPDGTSGPGNVSARGLGADTYQLDAWVRLEGGIAWTNPLYRMEFVRHFDGTMDFSGMELVMTLSPRTDTTAYWQTPYRARIGLLDEKDRVMFGSNVSLSEGVPTVASLEVSLENPLPKGLVYSGFDPCRVKAILINLEASHTPQPARDIGVSFIGLTVRPADPTAGNPIRQIDFSRFTRNPASWELTLIVEELGGFVVGVNLPFPEVDVPPNVLEVPLIYPCVGMKPTDPAHFGLSSPITYAATTNAFTVIVNNNMHVVRIMMMGHAEGVFIFDEKGRDIAEFAAAGEAADLMEQAAGMDVEDFVELLHTNEATLFERHPTKGHLLGLEEHVETDFLALLDILQEVEQQTGKRLAAVVSLLDFMVADNKRREGPFLKYVVGEHPEVVIDPRVKVKAQALIWKLMKTLRQDPRFKRYIVVVELMNEPANANALATRRHFPDLVNFCGAGLYLLKDALGADIPVSVGFRSWPDDLRFWSAISEGIEILIPHYWRFLESYNIDREGMWPLELPPGELWNKLGTTANGRFTGLGETDAQGGIGRNLARLQRTGHQLVLVWSLSGHDGFDCKPWLGDMGRHQQACMGVGGAFWVDVESGPNGTVNQQSGWRDYGTPIDVEASAHDYYHFETWTGHLPEGLETSNPVSLLVTSPWAMTADFAENRTSEGVPEWWLAQYGWTNSFEEAALADQDQDGMPTAQEWICLTSPTDPQDLLEADFGDLSAAGQIVLQWPSSSNRTYSVLESTNLVEGFSELAAGIAGTPPMNVYTVTTDGVCGPRFYEIGVRLP